MKVLRFEDLIAWQKGQDLAVEVYKEFENNKDLRYRNQICTTMVSVSNNIAEGFDRSSDADFSRFLYISIGSCSEVKSMTYLANRLGYITEERRNTLNEDTNEVSRIIRGLIKSLKTKK